jgi:hypothetical protein
MQHREEFAVIDAALARMVATGNARLRGSPTRSVRHQHAFRHIF